MNPFLACTTRPKRRTPSQSCLIHRDLETAMLHARSIDKPVAWAPPQPFSFMGREGDALMIHTDGLCRRVKLWNKEARKWIWYFTPSSTRKPRSSTPAPTPTPHENPALSSRAAATVHQNLRPQTRPPPRHRPQVTPMSPATAIFLLLAIILTVLFGLHLLFRH